MTFLFCKEKKMNKKAFTLLELIVVIAIIGFLSMVWIMTFMQWFTKSRDASRVAAMQNMSMALETSLARETELPEPDNAIEIKSGSQTLFYQWKFGTWVVAKLPEIKKAPKDPKDNKYYTYTLSGDKKTYTLLAMMELETIAYNPFIQEVYAENTPDYTNRYPYCIWEIPVFLRNSDNVPIEDSGSWSSIELTTVLGTFKKVCEGIWWWEGWWLEEWWWEW